MYSHYTHTRITTYQFWNDIFKLQGCGFHRGLMKFALTTELPQMTTKAFPPNFEEATVSKMLVSMHQSNVLRFQRTINSWCQNKITSLQTWCPDHLLAPCYGSVNTESITKSGASWQGCIITSTVLFFLLIYEMLPGSLNKHPQWSVLSEVTCKAFTCINRQHLAQSPSPQTVKNCTSNNVKAIAAER